MIRFLRLLKWRSTSTASSSNSHGMRTLDEPCRRLCDDSSPNATHRLYRSGVAVSMKPLMSWLQKPNPHNPSDRPPRSVSAIETYVDELSPPQWTGYFWLPHVA